MQKIDAQQLRLGQHVPVGLGCSEVIPTIDFETYSEAGFVWREGDRKFIAPKGATRKGIFAVGAAAYASHPSAEILCLYYDLREGRGPVGWVPGMPPPQPLLDYLATGAPVEAHNSAFERWVWNRVGCRLHGWPELPVESLRDSMAKAYAWGLPGALAKLSDVLELPIGKDKEGTRLLNKFSIPRNPTKKNPATRTLLGDDPEDARKLYSYCGTDVLAESQASAWMPDLIPDELEFWLASQRSNARGVALDMDGVAACIDILDQALARYDAELHALTAGTVSRASEVQKLTGWLGAWGVSVSSLDEEHVTAALARDDLPAPARRALEIRQKVGSASVKKVYAMDRHAVDGRAHDLFVYHRARTGRDGGEALQPQNLPKAGPKLNVCGDAHCGKTYGRHLTTCPWCAAPETFSDKVGWGWEYVDDALAAIRTRSLDWVEHLYGDALLTISGCIRGLFTAAPGKELICSDFSSIEAVVTAALAGEQWRLDAFERGDDIYLTSAAAITGKTLGWYMANGGKSHPDRQKIGKPAELGLGFGGWVGAWRQFDKSDNFTDDEVKQNIIAWREASPAVVELWGGQTRGKPWKPTSFELYGLEGAAIAAVQNPGERFTYRLISYSVHDDVLYCHLPSGRNIAYHRPRLAPSTRWEGTLSLSFEGYNSNPKQGAMGWVRMDTYGGKLAENAIQAVARDFMRDAVVRLERAGYPPVLRVHDEIAAEVPGGYGSIFEFERLMEIRPPWACDWPIRAAGGWRGKRYRKD